jgi:hypothetical protein
VRHYSSAVLWAVSGVSQIAVSPADARTVVFPTISHATSVWVKVCHSAAMLSLSVMAALSLYWVLGRYSSPAVLCVELAGVGVHD